MGVGPLCRLFGKSRQAYYKKEWHLSDVEQVELIVLELIAIVRRELPGLGLHKLYKCIYQPLRTNNIKMGRDKLNTLMRSHGLLIVIKRRGPRTTNSNHVFRRYPDLAKNLEVVRSEQLWVSDITYISISYDFNYLSLITDAYSKKIMGYCLHPYLTNEGTINALTMAINSRIVSEFPLMHHSDRGVQYCSYDYVKMLNKEKISISMTQNGEAYENPIAERINGILKTEFDLGRVFKSRTEAVLAVKMAIEAYNNIRPHMSCGYLTPAVAHLTMEPLQKCWKNTRKKKPVVLSV
ncbi:IS3 family transposase [Mucilaginibacter sp. McL0603]|uniref:IS3 family transposase n=1 Tax=Mucilaginibacter sp. McL0603 TaxID=3415670 RepID=UPI003CE68ED5